MAFTPRLAPHFMRLLIVAVIGLMGVSGAAHAQDYGQSGQPAADQQDAEQQDAEQQGDQYRCDDSRTRCAYYRCDPSGRSCERSSDWQVRDYNRGVDGDAPREDGRADADRNVNDAQRYGAYGNGSDNDRSGSDQSDHYARNEQDQSGQDQAGPPPPNAARREDGAEYRCTDDGQRCAYYRCDSDGENCHRISGWSSRADSNRRPDYNGW